MGNYTRVNKGNSLLEFVDTFVVIDIETTGFSSTANEMIEIAALKVVKENVEAEFHSLIKIEGEVPQNITNLTGITNEMLALNGRDIESVLREVDEFIGNNVILGHNVHFDINFLYDYYERYLGKSLSNDFVDTLRLAKALVKNTYNHKLSTLARKFEIENNQAHRALNDVHTTLGVWRNLKYIEENFVDIRMSELRPTLKRHDLLCNKKVSIKSKLKYIEDSILKQILQEMDSKPYFFMSAKADVLLVNDTTYQKLQEPLDQDPTFLFFNDWMVKAQTRMADATLTIISETDFCEQVGIPTIFDVTRERDESNPLFGKICVFTGVLERMNRKQAETIVQSIGGKPGNSLTKKTDYLILGNNDYNASVKNGKSSKHMKAEMYQSQGLEIEIIPEDVFYQLISEE